MATLDDIEQAGGLIRFDGNLEADEMPERALWHTPEYEAWIGDVLNLYAGTGRKKITPSDEVYSLSIDFILGRPMAYNVDLKKLDPIGHCVWEMKTAEVRVFGYFYLKKIFIAHHGEMKDYLKKRRCYAPHVQRVVEYMKSVGLDPPPCLTATRLSDVL